MNRRIEKWIFDTILLAAHSIHSCAEDEDMQTGVRQLFTILSCSAIILVLPGCRKQAEEVVTHSEFAATADDRQNIAESPEQAAPETTDSRATEKDPTNRQGDHDAPRPGLGSPAEPNEFAIASYNEGVRALQRGDFKDAIERFTLAIEFAPLFAQAFNNRGIANAKAGLFDQALDDFQEATLIDPQLSDAYKNAGAAGALAVDGKQFEQAVLLCRFALEKHRNGQSTGLYDEIWIPRTYNNLGIAYLRDKQWDRAIESFESALRIDPQFADAEQNLQMAQQVETASSVGHVDAKELCLAHTLYFYVLSLTDLSEREREDMSFQEAADFYGISKADVAEILHAHVTDHYQEATSLIFSQSNALRAMSREAPSFEKVVKLLQSL